MVQENTLWFGLFLKQSTPHITRLFEMIVRVLTTCHTQYI